MKQKIILLLFLLVVSSVAVLADVNYRVVYPATIIAGQPVDLEVRLDTTNNEQIAHAEFMLASSSSALTLTAPATAGPLFSLPYTWTDIANRMIDASTIRFGKTGGNQNPVTGSNILLATIRATPNSAGSVTLTFSNLITKPDPFTSYTSVQSQTPAQRTITIQAAPACTDNDGDGYGVSCVAGNDCNDNNAAIYPGAPEQCDGIDNDCDSTLDPATCSCTNGQTQICGTNVGACQQGMQTCSSGAWGVCINQIAPTSEVCDSLDNNCDGQVDEGVLTTYYLDNDGDGFGGATTSPACNLPAGYAAMGGDCNDNDPNINPRPSTVELCDGIDNNCDDTLDPATCSCTNGQTQICGTNVGACQQGTQTCSSGSWGVCINQIAPTAEICDSLDNNCDGQTDEGAVCPCSAVAWSCQPISSCQAVVNNNLVEFNRFLDCDLQDTNCANPQAVRPTGLQSCTPSNIERLVGHLWAIIEGYAYTDQLANTYDYSVLETDPTTSRLRKSAAIALALVGLS